MNFDTDSTSLLVGAAIALGSGFLGIVSEGAKGWLTHRTNISDKKASFRHQIAIELQDLLLELVSSTGELSKSVKDMSDSSGIWSYEGVPPDRLKSHRLLIARIGALHERLDDDGTREQVNAVLNLAAKASTAESEAEALEAHKVLMEQAFPANAALGEVIRRSHPS